MNLSGEFADDTPDINTFWEQFKTWFRDGAFEAQAKNAAASDAIGYRLAFGDGTPKPDNVREVRYTSLRLIRDKMRQAWETADLRERVWQLQLLRARLNQVSARTAKEAELPPPATAADDAVNFLSRIAHKLKLCDNGKKCTGERYLIGVKKLPKHCYDCLRAFRAVSKKEYWKARKEEANAKRRRDYRREKRGKVRSYRHHPLHADVGKPPREEREVAPFTYTKGQKLGTPQRKNARLT